MVHTIELSRMMSKETYEYLINTLNGTWYNGIAWYTTAYSNKGISILSLRKCKPKIKNSKGKWVISETAPDMYIAILTINIGVMFGGDGFLSTSILSFTPDFAKAIYEKIYSELPILELNPEYKKQGYDIYWNTGVYPNILREYYQLNAFKLRRIDYCLDVLLTPQQYIQLIESGKGINRKSYERLYFDNNSSSSYIDDDCIIDDEEPTFDDMEELLQSYTPDTNYIYYKSKSANINIYLKGEELKKYKLISPDNNNYNFLRIEFQIKKNKLNYLNRNHEINSRDFHQMPIKEYEKLILNQYIKQLTGTGIYVTYNKAMQIIDSSAFKSTKKTKLKKLLYLISIHHSVKTVLDKVANGTITELGKLSTVKSYIQDIHSMNINPVTISDKMRQNTPKIKYKNLSSGADLTAVILPNLLDILNIDNEYIDN